MRKILIALTVILFPSLTHAQSFTSTQCLGIVKPTPGNPAWTNTWGTQLNLNFDVLDEANAGETTINVPLAAGYPTVILTSTSGAVDQAKSAHVTLTGAITSNVTILWPAGLCRIFSVANNTTGSFQVLLGVNNGSGAPAGTTVVVPQGIIQEVVDDGTNLHARSTAGGNGIAVQQTLGAYPSKVIAPSGTSLTLNASNAGQIISSANAGGVATYTLPNPSSVGNGFSVGFTQVTNNITIQTGSGTIFINGPQGSTNSFSLNTTGASVALTSDGANWAATAVTIAPSIPAAVVATKIIVFTSSGTYTPSTGILFAEVTCAGGGAGGGGILSGGGLTIGGGAGSGGAGGSAQVIVTAAQITSDGGAEAVTIGAGGAGGAPGADGVAGGTTSFGSRCVATGGASGGVASAGGFGFSGIGGTGTVGQQLFIGAPGTNPSAVQSGPSNNFFGLSGVGGSSPWGGGGGFSVAGGGCNNGSAARGFSSGGSGASFQTNNGAISCGGGAGTQGFVRIIEYLSQ